MFAFSIVMAALFGALIGSFANVVIYRLPAGESVVYPGSRCPSCRRRLGVLDLVPVLSWLLLRGRCRSCGVAIAARYPLIEALTAFGFALLVWRWPPERYGLSALPLVIIFALLVIMAMIDVDHQLLPDVLTFPALALALAGTLLYEPGSELPSLSEALFGAALGAGVIVLINRLGSLVLRRLADTKERLWPLGMDQVNLAALAGALGGWWVGGGVAVGSVVANLVSRKTWRLPEPLLYALWLVALVVGGAGIYPWLGPLDALTGSVVAAGGVAVLGALFWWLADVRKQEAKEEPAPDPDELEEPVAMGFGDVKLAAVLGAMLGWQLLVVALFLSFVIGALGGLIGRALGGDRQIPFGPYLALGALVSLFVGAELIAWYVGLLTG